MDKAEKHKNDGNSAFSNQDYRKALDHYAEGLKINSEDHILLANRAAVNLQLGEFVEVVSDCDEVIKLNPLFAKAYYRKAMALFSMESSVMMREAKRTLELGMDVMNRVAPHFISPLHESLIDLHKRVDKALDETPKPNNDKENLPNPKKTPR